MINCIVGITFILCLIFPVSAFAGIPLDTVKGHVDKVLDVLHDPALKAESSKKVKKDKIRAISEKMFDFTELSKRTLAQNWSKLSPEQQNEFVELYTFLLSDTYTNKIMAYTDEKIAFGKEIALTEKTVEVRSTVVRTNGDIPIYYRVIMKDGLWRVYDVVIEGVSLINNYRSQFREILANKPPESLLETLRKKVGKA
ncbi:MAG TPA: ABC transporter substrate-binding protein [Thermodesulfovibrionales bacterium]|nr:ABC transporter substrate-binding protein [Thermodesulfovibrionales bacterium]